MDYYASSSNRPSASSNDSGASSDNGAFEPFTPRSRIRTAGSPARGRIGRIYHGAESALHRRQTLRERVGAVNHREGAARGEQCKAGSDPFGQRRARDMGAGLVGIGRDAHPARFVKRRIGEDERGLLVLKPRRTTRPR